MDAFTIETSTPTRRLHFHDEYVRKGDFRRIERPLCLCGNAHEQNDLTKRRQAVTCSACKQMLDFAERYGVDLHTAASTVINMREWNPGGVEP